jgi:hypothetical protein
VCTASGDQTAIELAADGNGGFVAVWEDRRTGGSDIRACRFDAEAAPVAGWPTDGLLVCGAAGDQTRPQVVVDGAGVQVCWEDGRGGGLDIGVQRLAPDGTLAPGWPSDGLLICAAAGDQSEPRIALDGWNGSYVAWLDARTGLGNDLFAQRVAADGSPVSGWPTDGYGLTVGRDCHELRLMAYGSDRCLVAWRDDHHDGGDICVTRLLPGSGVPTEVTDWTAAAVGLEAWPNPATSGLHIAWRLPAAQPVTIDVFDVRGHRVRSWSPGVLAAGAHRRDWNGRDASGARVPAGVYWIRVLGNGLEGTRKVVLTR